MSHELIRMSESCSNHEVISMSESRLNHELISIACCCQSLHFEQLALVSYWHSLLLLVLVLEASDTPTTRRLKRFIHVPG